MLPEYFDFFMPARVIAGPGVVAGLGEEMAGRNWSRCYIITDRVVRELGLLDRLVQGLGANVEVVGIFDEVVPNSEVGLVERGAELARKARPDFLLALGGGSNIDTAKAINAVLSRGGHILDYEGFGQIDGPLTPLVAVPTTAGTGSEVTRFAVIKDSEREAKLTFLSPFLIPDLAVLDPELTLDLPAGLTATTAMDALTHALEAHLSTAANPVASGLAMQATRLIFTHLPAAFEDGKNLTSRYGLLVAATMAGMAFNSAMVGIVHAMAHALGGIYNVPHGLANAVLLSYGLTYNLPSAVGQLNDMAVATGLSAGNTQQEEGAALLLAKLRTLNEKCGIPLTLRDVGVPREGLRRVAELAAVDGAIFTNPREAGEEEILEILTRAY